MASRLSSADVLRLVCDDDFGLSEDESSEEEGEEESCNIFAFRGSPTVDLDDVSAWEKVLCPKRATSVEEKALTRSVRVQMSFQV